MAEKTALPTVRWWRRMISRPRSSIGTKIILPYLVLTLAVAAVGAFVVTRLVTSTLAERFNNQLVDAGRVVAESMVAVELERLAVLRLVAFSEGVPSAMAESDADALSAIVPQILANSSVDTALLLDGDGNEVFSWQRPPPEGSQASLSGHDLGRQPDVQLVLAGQVDEFGNKRAFSVETTTGNLLVTAGPVILDDGIVGAALVATDLGKMVVGLTQSALARVTLYNRNGEVLATTLGLGGESAATELRESPALHPIVVEDLRETPETVGLVAELADNTVPLGVVEILNQEYQLAYGDWQLRGESYGLFSVALPRSFVFSTVLNSRTSLSIIFSIATLAVFALGFVIARGITKPLGRLVQTSVAITQGHLDRRTGIIRTDEIGTLAHSFDLMTSNLADRNRQLAKQASELETILNSIADGVIVLDANSHIVASNPAARRILPNALVRSADGNHGDESFGASDGVSLEELLGLDVVDDAQRFDAGGRVFSALAAPVKAANGDETGKVVVLRDITREAEVEELKDGFITSVSHELRTPLTSIKGFIELLMVGSAESLDPQYLRFAQVISDNTDMLMEHVNKLIDIAEIQNGTLRLRKQQEPLARLIRETVENWQEKMAGKALSLELTITDDHMWVSADTVRLVWAIDNLLQNARDYTPEGGSVEVHLYRQGSDARLDVIDSGIGISESDQTKLFGRFVRIQNEHTFHIPGIGLDLYITRSIVEAHGGRVKAESRLGTGSKFGISLPLVEPPAEVAGE